MNAIPKPLQVVILDRATLPSEITFPSLGFPNEIRFHATTPSHAVAERIAKANIVITNKVPITTEALDHAPDLKLVAIAATGHDNVDPSACQRRGVTVCNVRNYAQHTVPEHTFALILALRRSICAYRQSVEAGAWLNSGQFCYFDYPIRDLAGSTLGVIGDGVLGRAVADLGRGFGMRVLFASHKGISGMGPFYTPFGEVLRTSDVITLHAPLTPSSRNMIGTTEFALMEQRPLLINTSRGGLVDEDALYDAMVDGQISGAAFDVATTEPPPRKHPLMRLVALPNFVLTPRVAWASREAIERLVSQLFEMSSCSCVEPLVTC